MTSIFIAFLSGLIVGTMRSVACWVIGASIISIYIVALVVFGRLHLFNSEAVGIIIGFNLGLTSIVASDILGDSKKVTRPTTHIILKP